MYGRLIQVELDVWWWHLVASADTVQRTVETGWFDLKPALLVRLALAHIEWPNVLVGPAGLTGWLNWLVLIGWTCFTNIMAGLAGLKCWTDLMAELAGWTTWPNWLDLFYQLNWLDWQAGLIECLNFLVGLAELADWTGWSRLFWLTGWSCFTGWFY